MTDPLTVSPTLAHVMHSLSFIICAASIDHQVPFFIYLTSYINLTETYNISVKRVNTFSTCTANWIWGGGGKQTAAVNEITYVVAQRMFAHKTGILR